MAYSIQAGDTRDGVDEENIEVNIDWVHHVAHEGKAFVSSEGMQLTSSGEKDYVLTTPNSSIRVHLLIAVISSGPGTFRFYEGGDRVGTNLDNCFNRNRNSATVATMTIAGTLSGGTTDGTLIMQADYGTAQGSYASGAGIDWNTELILKPNTQYILRLVSQANNNNYAVVFHWYEVTL